MSYDICSSDEGVVIIGAGPAGLTLGYELKQRGVPSLLLERGSQVGSSWRRMPARLKLVSPWKSNVLPGSSTYYSRHHEVSREEYARYLHAYALEHGLVVRTNTEVVRVESGERLLIHTPEAIFGACLVVNATGYFSNPFIPDIPELEPSSIPRIHSAYYRDAASLPLGKNARILIVGKRLTASQIMIELVEAGHDVVLSHATPIRFGASPAAWWVLFRIFPWLEKLKLWWYGRSAPSNDVRMPGGKSKELIRSGEVKTHGPIAQFAADTVVFCDGTTEKFDLVIFATGFRPALQHLQGLSIRCNDLGVPILRDLESVSVPGLFFLGIDQSRNFQSRFIRGIREDAKFLAERLAAHFSKQVRLRAPDTGVAAG